MADTNIDPSTDPSTSEDPFAGVDFSKPMPALNGDNAVQILNAFNPSATPFQSFTTNSGNTPISTALMQKNTKGGAARVNANSNETGTVAITGADGRVTLTNVAKDPISGKEVPINGDANKAGGYQANTAISIPVTNNVYNALSQLKGATDIESARGIFSNLQESLVKESSKIENEATTFALNKIGVPKMESMLAQSEASDRSDPMWYPGIGDSPITAKLRTEIGVARGYADAESKRFLDNNLGYKMLKNNAAQANVEMTRVQKVADRKGAISDNIDLRRADKEEAKQADLETKSGVISADQMARIQVLLPGEDLSGNDGVNPKIKALQLYTGNKSKDFRAAVDAEGSQLPTLALMGNSFAESLTVRQEATNTGLPEAQVKAQLQAAKIWMANPQNIVKAITQMSGNETEGKKNVAAHALALTSSDLGEKNKATAIKAQAALWYMNKKKNEQFMGDVASWNSIDPAFQAASDTAAKTTGKRDIESVLTAYVGDAVGPEAMKRYSAFNQLIDAAGSKHSNSIFGRPDTMSAKAMVVRGAVGGNTFRKWMASIGKTPFIDVAETLNPETTNMGKQIYNSEFAKSVRLMTGLGEQPKAPIDPLTGKPFGE